MKKLLSLSLLVGTGAFAGGVEQKAPIQQAPVVVQKQAQVQALACPNNTAFAIDCVSDTGVEALLCPRSRNGETMYMVVSDGNKTVTGVARHWGNFSATDDYKAMVGDITYELGITSHYENESDAFFIQEVAGYPYSMNSAMDMKCKLPF